MRRSMLIGVSLALLLSVFASLSVGTLALPVSAVLGALLDPMSGADGVTPEWMRTIVWDLRLPRTLTALLIGAGLAASGTSLQAVFRNPLADPSVLGIASGAALGGSLAIHLAPPEASTWAVPACAFGLALATGTFVYSASLRGGRVDSSSLLLMGIAAGSLLSALTSLVVSLTLADYRIGRQLLHWLMGGLDGRTHEHAMMAAGPILVGCVALGRLRGDLDALLLGEIHAASVGVDVHAARRTVVLATSLITAGAVSVAGVVPFVGLVVPHALRLLVGPMHRVLLPASLIGGGMFVVLADILARRAIAPEEIHLGAVTAVVGAPLFIALLLRSPARRMAT